MELSKIGDIAAFVAAVNAGSLTGATRATGLTRSAIGKSIVRLETRFGVRLLNRTTRRLSLTDEGRVMFERCSQILEDLAEVDDIMATRRMAPSGTLKMTAPLSLGQRHILPILNEFLGNWPALQAHVSFADRYVDLIEEGFDIAIRIGEAREDAAILTRTIGWQHMVTCAAPSYLARRGTPTDPVQLAEHDTIFFMNGEKRRLWKFAAPDGSHLFEGPGRVNMDSSEAMRAAAVSGFGLVQLPRYLVDDAIRDGALVGVLEAFSAPPEPIRVIYPSKRHLSPRIRTFIDLLTKRMEQMPVFNRA